MTFFRMFQHLLPNARAWRMTVNKTLRQFFLGLSGLGSELKVFYDGIWRRLGPQTTDELTLWENQFALRSVGLTEQERRDRLDAAWKALGGQDPRYLQDTLQANGFDVYVHEWWEPGTEPVPGVKQCVTPRNPFSVLASAQIERFFTNTAGNPAVTCGNLAATCGASEDPIGYPLVNKLRTTVLDYITTAGNPAITCGNPAATCGSYIDFKEVPKEYFIPLDVAKWPYFLYLGGEVFGQPANVDPKRKAEFEALCLKICPAHQWLGIIVEYN